MLTDDSKWYIFRITLYNEKKVADILDIAGIEHYIPIQTVTRYWGKKQIQIKVPLFSGIGFACVDDFDFGMLSMIGEISLIRHNDNTCKTISATQLELIKSNPAEINNIL